MKDIQLILVSVIFIITSCSNPEEKDFNCNRLIYQENKLGCGYAHNFYVDTTCSLFYCDRQQPYWTISVDGSNRFAFVLMNMCGRSTPYGYFEIWLEDEDYIAKGEMFGSAGIYKEHYYKYFRYKLKPHDTLSFDNIYHEMIDAQELHYPSYGFHESPVSKYHLIKKEPFELRINDPEYHRNIPLIFSDSIIDIHPEDLIGVVLRNDTVSYMHVLDRSNGDWYLKKTYLGKEIYEHNTQLINRRLHHINKEGKIELR